MKEIKFDDFLYRQKLEFSVNELKKGLENLQKHLNYYLQCEISRLIKIVDEDYGLHDEIKQLCQFGFAEKKLKYLRTFTRFNNFYRVYDLEKTSDKALLEIKGIGKKTLNDIRESIMKWKKSKGR